MDGWLKALIAAACVVIIAGGGYYAIKENAAATQRAADEKEQTIRNGCAAARANSGLTAMQEYCKDRGY
ncbi:hypothetical protein ASG25_02010 [Rhizobium sp. Leaf384]|uniref:hypothetical protein n=1 Tax=unclassified Rhizobium TaxID=2613769 RepID=UPI00071618B8|nr:MULTISPECIES: hypothetical protein [unclassified Rhizobium]KQS74214.1 hypothetical protein ASG58_17075 [Rhizobium sp. Leaf383]KQS80409.1 hypothetical protein ASG25_02010 [Rhizobium sp. Leaf384]